MICACQKLRFIPLQSPRGDYNIEAQQFSIRQPDLLMFRSRNLINLKKMLFSKKQKNGILQNFESSYSRVFKGRLIKFLFCKQHNLLKTGMFVYFSLLQSVGNFQYFCEIIVLQIGFNSCKSSQMKQKTWKSMN